MLYSNPTSVLTLSGSVINLTLESSGTLKTQYYCKLCLIIRGIHAEEECRITMRGTNFLTYRHRKGQRAVGAECLNDVKELVKDHFSYYARLLKNLLSPLKS